MRTIAFWSAVLLVFVIPFENLVMSDAGSTVSRLLGLGVAGLWALSVILEGRIRPLRPFHLFVALFVLWHTASLLWTLDTELTWDRIQTYLQLLGLVLILWDLFTTEERLRIAMQAYVLGGFVSIASLLHNYLEGLSYSTERYSAGGFHPNDLGLVLALGIPVAWYLGSLAPRAGHPLLLRVANLVYLPASLFAIFLTASRGTLAAASTAFVYVLASLTLVRLPTRLLCFLGALGMMLAMQPHLPHGSLGRVAEMGLDLNGRLELWTEGLAVFAGNPVLGVGSGAFKASVSAHQSPHNFAVSLLAEVGLVGFALFAAILVSAVRAAIRQPGALAGLWLTVLLVWMLGAATHNWEHRKQTWLFFGLVVASASVARPSPASGERFVGLGARLEPERA